MTAGAQAEVFVPCFWIDEKGYWAPYHSCCIKKQLVQWEFSEDIRRPKAILCKEFSNNFFLEKGGCGAAFFHGVSLEQFD
jgi:hypothetical protein